LLGAAEPKNPTIVTPENDGKTVFVTGKIVVDVPARDPRFGYDTFSQPWLKRSVEYYVWEEKVHEKEERSGDFVKKSKEYTYKSVWKSSFINSSSFKMKGYENGPTPDLQTETFLCK